MNTIAHLRTLRAIVFVSLSVVLEGCSSTADQGLLIFADPGKYQYHNCEQLSAAAVNLARRERQIVSLIATTSQSVVGTALSGVPLRGDLRLVKEELAVVEAAARSKNCVTAKTWRSNTIIH